MLAIAYTSDVTLNHSMKVPFKKILRQLRERANLTNAELADMADVPRSLVSGLETGNRRAGEFVARKLGQALGLEDEELQEFILASIDMGTDKVLFDIRRYPSKVLNMSGLSLKKANISPENISDCTVEALDDKIRMYLKLTTGETAQIDTTISLTT